MSLESDGKAALKTVRAKSKKLEKHFHNALPHPPQIIQEGEEQISSTTNKFKR